MLIAHKLVGLFSCSRLLVPGNNKRLNTMYDHFVWQAVKPTRTSIFYSNSQNLGCRKFQFYSDFLRSANFFLLSFYLALNSKSAAHIFNIEMIVYCAQNDCTDPEFHSQGRIVADGKSRTNMHKHKHVNIHWRAERSSHLTACKNWFKL